MVYTWQDKNSGDVVLTIWAAFLFGVVGEPR